MRKLAVISGAALLLAGTWTAVSAQDGFAAQPAANAYLSMEFGHPNPKAATFSPLHYGLKMQYDSRMPAFDAASRPPLAQLDFDARGNRIGSVGGVPFMARIRPSMQNEEGTVGEDGVMRGPAEGIEFFDLALLGVGVAGLGYLIYEVAGNDESPDPLTDGGGDGGGGGGATGGDTGGLLGGLLGGGFAGNRGFVNVERDLEYQRWLDGGTGHMGDLTP